MSVFLVGFIFFISLHYGWNPIQAWWIEDLDESARKPEISEGSEMCCASHLFSALLVHFLNIKRKVGDFTDRLKLM